MGQVARALGQGTEFVYKDKTYTLSPWTFEIQGTFEKYLEGEAVRAARRMAQFLTDDEKKELFAHVNRDIVSGVYSFGSRLVFESINNNHNNLAYLLYLMLRGNNKEVTLEFAKEIVEHDLSLVFQSMNAAMADPTTPPETETKTTPVVEPTP